MGAEMLYNMLATLFFSKEIYNLVDKIWLLKYVLCSRQIMYF